MTRWNPIGWLLRHNRIRSIVTPQYALGRHQIDLAGLDAWSRALVQPGVHRVEFLIGSAESGPTSVFLNAGPLGYERFLAAIGQLTNRFGPTRHPQNLKEQPAPVVAWAFDDFQLTLQLCGGAVYVEKHVAAPIHPERAEGFTWTAQTQLEIHNDRAIPRIIVVEPWGDAYTLDPDAALTLFVAAANAIPQLACIDRDDVLTILATGANEYQVWQNGEPISPDQDSP